MSTCIECGEKQEEGYWNAKGWERLMVVIVIGEKRFERSGKACPKCCEKWREMARYQPEEEK